MLMMFGGAVIGMITGLLGYTVIVDGVFSVVNFLILTGAVSLWCTLVILIESKR